MLMKIKLKVKLNYTKINRKDMQNTSLQFYAKLKKNKICVNVCMFKTTFLLYVSVGDFLYVKKP